MKKCLFLLLSTLVISSTFIGCSHNKNNNTNESTEAVIDIINSKIGNCWDQTELERYWFNKNN